MDRKNRVKMLINKLWKTREIQAAFGIQAFKPGVFPAVPGQRKIPAGEMAFTNAQSAVNKCKNLLKTRENTTTFC